MLKNLPILILLTLVLALEGCAAPPKCEKVEFTKVKVVKQQVPEELTQPCIPNRPPKREDYLKLKPHEREAAMTNYAIDLLGTIKECNNRMEKIKELYGKELSQD